MEVQTESIPKRITGKDVAAIAARLFEEMEKRHEGNYRLEYLTQNASLIYPFQIRKVVATDKIGFIDALTAYSKEGVWVSYTDSLPEIGDSMGTSDGGIPRIDPTILHIYPSSSDETFYSIDGVRDTKNAFKWWASLLIKGITYDNRSGDLREWVQNRSTRTREWLRGRFEDANNYIKEVLVNPVYVTIQTRNR